MRKRKARFLICILTASLLFNIVSIPVSASSAGIETTETQSSEEGEELVLFGLREEDIEDISDEQTDDAVGASLAKAVAYLQQNVTNPGLGTINGEWSVMAMARYGGLSEETKKNYLANVYQALAESNGVPDPSKYTEFSRMILAFSAIGESPKTVAGYNLLKPLADSEMVSFQGINGPIFALIAFDSRQYDIPNLSEEELAAGKVQTTRNGLIQEILNEQCEDGGWATSGSSADPDMTAMAVQALTPYYGDESYPKVKAAIDRAVETLSDLQEADGGYSSWGDKNLESSAQVMIALSGFDSSLLSDERFVKNGNSLPDVLLSFQAADGSFSHLPGGDANAMSTDQGTLALLAYTRALAGETSLYDMTDVEIKGDGEETAEKIAAFKQKLEALSGPLTLKQEEDVFALEAELSGMLDFAEKEQLQKQIEDMKAVFQVQRQEVSELDTAIWNEIQPLKLSVRDRETVDALMGRYKAIPEDNRTYLKNEADLLYADIVIGKLEKGVLAAELFRRVMDASVPYEYEGGGYQITLKANIPYKSEDMKAGITVKEGKDRLIFETDQEGTLPGKVAVTVQTDLDPGTYMLCVLDSSVLKRVQWVSVKEKEFTCTLSKGGKYYLIEADMEEDETEDSDNRIEITVSGTRKAEPETAATASSSKTGVLMQSNLVKASVKDGIVAKKEFEAVKGTKQNLQMEGKTESGSAYTLTIYGEDVGCQYWPFGEQPCSNRD